MTNIGREKATTRRAKVPSAMRRKMDSHGRRLTSQDEEDLMTEKSPFFISIELPHVKQEEPDEQDENAAPTIEFQAPPFPRPHAVHDRSVLSPRSANAGAHKKMLPRASPIRNVSKSAAVLSQKATQPARTEVEAPRNTPSATSAIEMALHIFAFFPPDHGLYIDAENTFVKERVESMLWSFDYGHETQALWVAARLRERQVPKDHIEKVIERLMEVEAKEMAAWMQSKVKDVLLLQGVCRKVLQDTGGNVEDNVS